MSDSSDFELVVLAQRGDKTAFSKLVQRYHGRVFNVVYGLVGDMDDAEDLVQDAFVKAYRSLPKFQNRAQFYTWIYRIAINCFRDWCKSAQRTREVSSEWMRSEDGDGVVERAVGNDVSDERVQNRDFYTLIHMGIYLINQAEILVVLADLGKLTYIFGWLSFSVYYSYIACIIHFLLCAKVLLSHNLQKEEPSIFHLAQMRLMALKYCATQDSVCTRFMIR